MPSLIPGFEYDIFISYRHKDNKGGHWVSEFVDALKTELEATFKEDISIYFDENPHDGLLETHNVDKSLEGKLKCLIFIPILSQTYCDPKSFAWQHELCVFNKLAKEDHFGRDIKLKSGNVGSRILPVQIHKLDTEDKSLIENELGGVLRSIEFIYRTAGVIRPLLSHEEDSKANLNHTFFRDQINKVARGSKELIDAMLMPAYLSSSSGMTQPRNLPAALGKKFSIAATFILAIGIVTFSLFYFLGVGKKLDRTFEKSIAVLPFENMNKDPEYDYFSNGIAEDILNRLIKISDLQVKSRTSTMQYKGTTKTASTIGNELGVNNILEGSVRRVGDTVRIVVQLIDTETDTQLWGETYDRDLKDVLSVQSEIAVEIALALKAKLTSTEKENLQQKITHSITAYDYFLKAREIMNQNGVRKEDFESSLALINQSLKMDPYFSTGIAFKGRIWMKSIYTLGLNDNIIADSVNYYATRAIKADPSEPAGYLLRADLSGFLGNSSQARQDYAKAYELAPKDGEVLYGYGTQLIKDKKERGADLILQSIENQYRLQDAQYYSSMALFYYYSDDLEAAERLFLEAKKLDPGDSYISIALANIYWVRKEYDKGIQELKRTTSDYSWVIDNLAYCYYFKGDYQEAINQWQKYKEIEAGFEDTTQTVPFRHRLGMAYAKIDQQKKADSLYAEQLKISSGIISGARAMGTWGNKALSYYDISVCYALMDKKKEAVQYLDSAWQLGFAPYSLVNYEPAFENLKSRDDFKAVFEKVENEFNFRKEAFSNALNRAKIRTELEGLINK